MKDVGFKLEPHVCNKCHDVLITVYELKNIAILNINLVNFRCILWGISRDEAISRLNNSVLEDKGSCEIKFGANKTPVKVIKEGVFRETYFTDIYPGVNGKWYKKSWKEFDQLKDIDKDYYCSYYYDVSLNKYGVEGGISLRFWENMCWINEIDPYGWFQWYFRYWLGRRSEDDERQIDKWKKIVSRFRGKLVKMIKDADSKYDNYSISSKVRHFIALGL